MTHKLTPKLFYLAKEFQHLLSTEDPKLLSSDECLNFTEFETRLLAYGNLLRSTNVDDLLLDEIKNAEAYLSATRLRLEVTRRRPIQTLAPERAAEEGSK